MDKLPIDCVFHCFCCKVDGTLHSLEFLFQALMVRSLIANFNIRYFLMLKTVCFMIFTHYFPFCG